MSLKTKILLSIFGTATVTTMLAILLIVYLFSRSVGKYLFEEYNRTYHVFNLLLEYKEKEIWNSEIAPVKVHMDIQCRNINAYFMTLPSGTVLGVEKVIGNGCLFVGEPAANVLEILKVVHGVEYAIVINRDWLDLKGEALDTYMNNKVLVGDLLVEKVSDEKLLSYPLDIRGWAVFGGLTDRKLLMMEVPLRFKDGAPRGKVVLVKDIHYIYKQTYETAGMIVAFSVILSFLISTLLYKTVSRVISDIKALQVSMESVEKGDFSKIERLKDSSVKDEISKLKGSYYSMASRIKNLLEELERKNRELEELAFYDPLTELPNRRFFLSSAQTLLENAKRYGTPISLMVMDIDNFKKINDTYGHEAGDLILKKFASILKEELRRSDLPARFGGEEFVVLLPNTDAKDAYKVAERIRTSFKRSSIVYRDQEVKTTVSIGLASYGLGLENIDDLIRLADIALYEAKGTGKDKVVIYRKELEEGQKRD